MRSHVSRFGGAFRGEGGYRRLGGACLRGKTRMLCKHSKGKIRIDVETDLVGMGRCGVDGQESLKKAPQLGDICCYLQEARG